jgi:hypothetical protein
MGSTSLVTKSATGDLLSSGVLRREMLKKSIDVSEESAAPIKLETAGSSEIFGSSQLDYTASHVRVQ